MLIKRDNKREYFLIFLCWLVYTSSYIGRLSFNSNINSIGNDYKLNYSDTGLISTMFFLAYGIGQVINGILCNKYNLKLTIFTSLIVSSAMNFLFVLCENIVLLKYIWLINGFSMSFLWPLLVRVLSENISKKNINLSILLMGTTVASGTLITYGISALCAAILSYKIVFYIASILLIFLALVWFLSYKHLVVFKNDNESEVIIKKDLRQNKGIVNLGSLLVVLIIIAIANNFVKDGLTLWTPDILNTLYGIPDWLSILLTLFLPTLAIFGTYFAIILHKKIKNYILLCTVLYGFSFVLLLMVVMLIPYNQISITIGSFAFVSCFMAGVNNIITSMIPLEMREKVDSGKLVGILNGFCSLGSTLSAYSLGLFSDLFGWSAVFIVLIAVLIITIIIGIIYMLKNGNSSFEKFSTK